MTEMEQAMEALRAAEDRVLGVLRASTGALLRGGFVLHDFRDPVRAAIWKELVAEERARAEERAEIDS